MAEQLDYYITTDPEGAPVAGAQDTVRFTTNQPTLSYDQTNNAPLALASYKGESAQSMSAVQADVVSPRLDSDAHLNPTEIKLLSKLADGILDGDIEHVESILNILSASPRSAERVLDSMRQKLEAATPGMYVGYDISTDEDMNSSMTMSFKQSDQLGATVVKVSSLRDHAAFSTFRGGQALDPGVTFQDMFAPIWVQKRIYK